MRDGRSEKFWRKPLDADEIPRVRGFITIQEERCKGCTYCVEFCPTDVLAWSERFNLKGYHVPDVVAEEACNACRLCELLCPEFAIGIEEQTLERCADAS